MPLTFLGATRTVTGSMHLVEANGARLLLDCGLFQGRRKETYERNLNFPFDAAGIDGVILSHAHIDHSGNIPNLVKQGFQGPIWCTSATRDLCAAMLRDSGAIHEQDVAYVNKHRQRQGLPPVEPLYTCQDAEASLPHFVTIGYGRPFAVAPGVRLTFLDAGHILGSAITVLDIEEKGQARRLVFSGDLGRPGLPILRDPEKVQQADVLIMESTYGNRTHESREEAERTLRRVINDTYRRRGKVVIPAFAVGRTQGLVYALHRLADAHKIPDLPVFVDSPLAVNVTEIFRLHPECYDEEMREFLNSDHQRDPFGFRRLRYIRDVEDSKALNFRQDSAIIISASGMCEAGRILHHLKNTIGDPANTILFVGFQAEHTLGRRILDGQERVRIFGEEHLVRADVESIEGYSAHADQGELLGWLQGFDRQRLRQVFLVHGEEEAALVLAEEVRALGVQEVRVPEWGEVGGW
ncbi:MAG: MBL fold metallo-hydrolase [Anaerolineae bacterium]|nr:MBL fold metallo-hydrolase [Anaerolineae bacterium]